MNRTTISEAIVQRAAKGAHEAFKQIYDVYNDKVFNLTYYMLGNVDEAREATQEIFIKVFTSLHQFKFDSAFSTWLYRVSVNTCLDYIRRNKRHKTENIYESGSDSFIDTSAEPADTLVMRNQINKDIENALGSLRPELRCVMVLRFIDGLSYGEIARILQCSVGTVGSRLNRGYKYLGKALVHLKDEV